MLNVIYRLSDNGYVKPKFPYATKMHCLENALKQFDARTVHLFVDDTNLLDATREDIENKEYPFAYFTYYTGGSSAGSWRHIFNYAMDTFKDEEMVYFLEDDYLHRPNSSLVMEEGLEIAEYVSLYDHNDKYIPATQGGNPFIDSDGGEVTKVYRTRSTHWKLTNSTTMTFATQMQTLREDEAVWQQFTLGTHPNDFGCFLELGKRGRALITPIPGYSTHCEPRWASPGIDWSLY
jgi:hypothetical protein